MKRERPRGPSYLPEALNRQLSRYALAASAAGVSLLALTQPSEAKIVYTKAHQLIGTNGVYPLDLNHDGAIDFLLQEFGYLVSGSRFGFNALLAKEAFGNAVQGSIRTTSSPHYFAQALKKGARIGPQENFIERTYSSGESMVRVYCGQNRCSAIGQWGNVKNRYLGLKFQIDGETHYGWARLSVQLGPLKIAATLTGYAYETIPGKGIRAGQVCCDDNGVVTEQETQSKAPVPTATEPASRTATPASLGRLAIGARGISSWRQP